MTQAIKKKLIVNEGVIVKGGVNPEKSQITIRPPAPKPVKKQPVKK